ncbi:YfhO family protein [Streptomyces sp. NPDC007861]|uniref:YfhO family protein n=1 Tax=Streptomyces sp. NPDC007861 TaxID=3154893 RepID=UPI0033ECF940
MPSFDPVRVPAARLPSTGPRATAPCATEPSATEPRASTPRATVLAALLTVAAVCTGDAVARSFPFGPRTRSVNDLGNQFVPFHAHLWDLLHGRAQGGLLLNWQSGYGMSFLPDLGTYLGSPFSLLVGVFPREDIDLAVYVITVLKMAAAAAAMTGLLLALNRNPGPRGRWWAAGVLGASYALCGWSVVEAAYNTMWLDGLTAFPLLCLTGEWARARRRPVLAVVVVAAAWTANFYTAYMATIGAALVLLLRLLLDEEATVRDRGRALLRAAGATLLGTALAAPVLLPVLQGSKHAHPGWTRQFTPTGWTDVFARALPATYSFFSPAVFLGTGALLLVAALPFHRGVERRERLGWTGLAVAVALSMQWEPGHLAWHVFATPNGSPYRQSFVLAGILVIAAWTCLAQDWPGPRALLAGTGALAVLAAAAATSELAAEWSLPLFLAGLAGAGGGLVLARRRPARGGYAAVAALLMCGALVGQAAATVAYADRQKLGRLDDYPPWGSPHDARAAAVARADGWPRHRTDPGRIQLTGNDPLLVGGEGGGYYSSHTPAVFTRTMAALGAGWTSRGRNVQSLDNPVTDAVFSVGARVRAAADGDDVRVVRPAAGVPPLVTVRPDRPGGAPGPRFGHSPFRNQELLLGTSVYTAPEDRVCPAGTDVFVFAPDYTGWARRGDGPPVRLRGEPLRGVRAAMTPLGASTGPGSRIAFARGVAPHGWSGGCLHRDRLAAAVAQLKRTGAVAVDVRDDGVRAALPPGSTGTAVLAAPRIAGWRCNGRPAGGHLGLVAVPLDGRTTTVDCSFRPPGLRAGAAVGGAALLVLIAVAALPAVRGRARTRRRPATKTSPVQNPLAVRRA